jgi:acyl-CoA thioester hydrolase
MFEASTQVRVRYAETDQMGYVYYGNYATYFEVARVEALRQMGLSYRELEDQGIMMPVLENWSKYITPATYDELLTIKVSIKERPNVRIAFHYEIYNTTNKLIHEGVTKLVFVKIDTRRPCRIPDEFLKIINPHFE